MNIVGTLQRWMDSKLGRTFLNYAYSWGASVVILGTLFKLTHLPGANLFLFIGMGTEVVVFFLSAFDRSFIDAGGSEETASGTQAAGQTIVGGGIAAGDMSGLGAVDGEEASPAEGGQGGTAIIGGGGGGTTIIGGGGGGGTIVLGGGGESAEGVQGGAFVPSEGLQAAAAQQGIGGNSLLDIIKLANEEMLQRAQASLTPAMEEASKQYVEKLQLLTETLDKVEKQSARLTTDSEEMTNLNRTLTGINTVYELQLKSISQQVGTIDSINAQTRKMATQIEELNGVYARMIKALTVNMRNAGASPTITE